MATNRSNFPPKNSLNKGDEYQQQLQPQSRGKDQNPNVNPQTMMFHQQQYQYMQQMAPVDPRAMQQQQMYYAAPNFYQGGAPNPYYAMPSDLAGMPNVQQTTQQQSHQAQHSAHSIPTPPIQTPMQPQEQPTQPAPYKPVKRWAISIKDPNTGSIVAKEELARQERKKVTDTQANIKQQEAEQRSEFKNQLNQSVKSTEKVTIKTPRASTKTTKKASRIFNQVQHSAHSTPTPPIQTPMQPQEQPTQPTPYKPVKRSGGITIKDPNTGTIVAKEELAQQERTKGTDTRMNIKQQEAEQRNKFKDQVHQSVKSTEKVTIKAPPASTKVTIKAPPPETKPSPAKSDPVKQITPTAILQNSRSNSQSEDKTPEKLVGIEMSVQTTPSLQKTATKKQTPPSSKIPVPPKFEESKEKAEDKSPAKMAESAPISKDKVNDRKLDGETIIIDNSSTKEAKVTPESKVNGVNKQEQPVKSKTEEKPKKETKFVPEEPKAVPKETKAAPKETKPVPKETKPVPKETKPVPKETKAVPKETKPVPKETKPVPKDTKPASKETKPVPKETKPVPKETKPVPKETKPVPKETKPVPKETKSAPKESKAAPKEQKPVQEEPKAVEEPKKKHENLVISIPNGQSEIEDPSSASEESSAQFETPPATPSEVKPEIKQNPKPEVKPEAKPEAKPEVKAEVKYEEEAAPKETAPPAKEPAPAPIPAQAVEQKDDVEEGEIIEEKPVKKAGMITYTREELMKYREAQDTCPDYLPRYDCIMDKPILKMAPEPSRPVRSNNQFVPAWDQGSRNRSRGGGDRNRSMDKNYSISAPPKPRIIEHVLQAPVTRKRSQNAWLSKREDTEPADKKEDGKKLLRANVIAVLNKITPQNFKDLSVQIIQLGIDNMEKLEIAVELIFAKALLEPAFSQTYANLCKVMSTIRFPDDPNPKVSPFRKTLLNRCQKEFFREKDDEKIIEDKIAALNADQTINAKQREGKMEDLLYERSKMKKKMLGNINFIGELYNLSMISAKIIQVQCINNMLDKKSEDNHMDIESIECLAKLFTTVGQKLEQDAADSDAKKAMFEKSFKTFKDLSLDKYYPYRIKFMIQDLVDLRENGWVPRRQEAKPQRIEDIHREHAREEQEKKMEAAVAQQSRKVKRNDSRDDRMMRGSRDGRDKDYHHAVQKKPPSNFDMSKLSSSKQKVDSGNVVLGPSKFNMGWGRGSGTNSGANSPLSGSREDLNTSNRFDMLKPHDKRNLLPGRTSSAPAPRGKSSSRERRAPVNNSRGFSNKRTTSPSPVRAAPKREDLSDSEIQSRTKSIISEYFAIQEMEEAVDCIKEELKLVKKHNIFVEKCLEMVFESKPAHLPLLADLFCTLFVENPPLMNADGFLSGFQKSFECAEDLAIDIPGIYKNFGVLLGHCVAKEHINLRCVSEAICPLKESNKAGLVMCEVIKSAIDKIGDMGKMEIQKKWAKDRLSWPDISPDHVELIKKYEFEFLSSTTEPQPANTGADPAKISTSGMQITEQVTKLLESKEDKKNEKIFSFIESTVSEKERKEPAFIRELMKTVCNHCIDYHLDRNNADSEINVAKLTNCAPLLLKYIQCGKSNLDLELYALEAVQILAHELSHPRGLAYSIFCLLDDEDIITVKGFKHWRDNGHEQLGHGVTRQNLKKFFDELEESDSNIEPVSHN